MTGAHDGARAALTQEILRNAAAHPQCQPAWQTANEWLVDAGMGTVFANTGTVGSRESLYREGLVTASTGDEFYHYELRVVASETDDGYIVIQYLLNLLHI